MNNFVKLFTNPEFVTALFGVVFTFISLLYPPLEEHRAILLPSIVAITVTIATMFSIQRVSQSHVTAEKERTEQARIQLQTAQLQASQRGMG